jgi:hypothetical protein
MQRLPEIRADKSKTTRASGNPFRLHAMSRLDRNDQEEEDELDESDNQPASPTVSENAAESYQAESVLPKSAADNGGKEILHTEHEAAGEDIDSDEGGRLVTGQDSPSNQSLFQNSQALSQCSERSCASPVRSQNNYYFSYPEVSTPPSGPSPYSQPSPASSPDPFTASRLVYVDTDEYEESYRRSSSLSQHGASSLPCSQED